MHEFMFCFSFFFFLNLSLIKIRKHSKDGEIIHVKKRKKQNKKLFMKKMMNDVIWNSKFQV